MKTFEIEYEVPPLRAIYRCECDAESEQQARDFIGSEKPLWKIRKVSESDSEKPSK